MCETVNGSNSGVSDMYYISLIHLIKEISSIKIDYEKLEYFYLLELGLQSGVLILSHIYQFQSLPLPVKGNNHLQMVEEEEEEEEKEEVEHL